MTTKAPSQPSTTHRDRFGHSEAIHAAVRSRWSAGSSLLLDHACAYAVAVPGKFLRPLLLIESARAVGGTIDMVLPAAIGAECGHIASLVHDDIIDGDEVRRGQGSIQHVFGVDEAIIAGDALIFDLFRALSECAAADAANVVTALRVVSQAGIDMCRGQSMEGYLTRTRSTDVDSYLKMISLKTAAFFASSCECGAVLAGAPLHFRASLRRYGQQLGYAFQITDDLLPFAGCGTGKPDDSDLRNGRRTLPILLALRMAGPEMRHSIEAALSPEVSAGGGGSLDALRSLITGTGAVQASREAALDFVKGATEALAPLPMSQSRALLVACAETIAERVS